MTTESKAGKHFSAVNFPSPGYIAALGTYLRLGLPVAQLARPHIYYSPIRRHALTVCSAVATTASERSAQCRVLMRQVQDVLRQTGSLYNAPHLDCTFFLDKFANCKEQRGRKLVDFSSEADTGQDRRGARHTSEYHRNCHVTSRIRALTIKRTSPPFSYILSTPLIAFGENRIAKHA